MTDVPPRDVTLLLDRLRAGDEVARGDLISLVYDELRRVASILMKKERKDHTLAPTELVSEAVVRLLGGHGFEKAPDRSYLFAMASRAMREILVDHARRRAAGKRGGKLHRVPFDQVLEGLEAQGLDVVEVHEALNRLASFHERQSQVVTMRFFGGLTVPEIASMLGVSVSTVENDWRIARAWLSAQFEREGEA